MNEHLLKTLGANVLTSRKKLRKTFWGVAFTSPHHLVRPRVKKYKDSSKPTTKRRIACREQLDRLVEEIG